tara:strand:+ start:290 stop:688 length:399 start_codon:yes stop_codon:yes gene_type:complete
MKKNMITKFLGVLVLCLLITSCGPKVEVLKLSELSKDVLTEASKVQVFRLDNPTPKPDIKNYVGEVVAYSCKHLMTDPPASKGNALTQLKVKAVNLGANGIIDITFDTRGTDAWGTNCWESVQASGTAVIFK